MSCSLLFSMFLILPGSFSMNGVTKDHSGSKKRNKHKKKLKCKAGGS